MRDAHALDQQLLDARVALQPADGRRRAPARLRWCLHWIVCGVFQSVAYQEALAACGGTRRTPRTTGCPRSRGAGCSPSRRP